MPSDDHNDAVSFFHSGENDVSSARNSLVNLSFFVDIVLRWMPLMLFINVENRNPFRMIEFMLVPLL